MAILLHPAVHPPVHPLTAGCENPLANFICNGPLSLCKMRAGLDNKTHTHRETDTHT